jgi:primosomal protein N' (replication factor Y)
VSRLRSRLESIAPDHRCVVWHSHLSEGERLDGWMALATGEARVVVGARSAVFAPVRGLRLIVVDEEHEPAYKQDESPRYQGRDVAVMRAKLCGAHCILGSATPALETWANARAGRYGLLRLTERVDGRGLPHIQVVDMKIEVMRQRGAATLSRKLVDAMYARFERREQTILFIHRGVSPLQHQHDLPSDGRDAALPFVRRLPSCAGALPELCGTRHPLAWLGHAARGGGGSPGAPAGADRAH